MSQHRGDARRRQNAETINAIVLMIGLALIGVGWVVWRIFRLFKTGPPKRQP
jgi:hypothetical protein